MDSTKSAVLAGTFFGAGLAVSQMTNPAKVIAFLDFTGEWDPTLAFVRGGALVVSATANQLASSRGQTRERTQPGQTGRIDGRLLVGSSLFGVGWGLAGFCPGPALAALVTGSGDVALFVLSMLCGMGLFRLMPASGGRQGETQVQDSLA